MGTLGSRLLRIKSRSHYAHQNLWMAVLLVVDLLLASAELSGMLDERDSTKFTYLWDVMLCRQVGNYQWICLPDETQNNTHRVKFMMIALWDLLMILKSMNVNGDGGDDDILIILMIPVIVMVVAMQSCLKIIVKISSVNSLNSSYLLSKCLKIWEWNVVITEQV